MKKNVLALSIAAMIGGLGFAGAASAQLAVNDSGMGHMLLVPYFTVQDGNMSVFHVVNTDTVNGKAMKVRFRGAANSDDILDFQVFMSPGDVWTAAVVKGANDVAQLVTTDGTCTMPAIGKGVPVSFVTDRVSGATDAAKAAQTREGYVEIFNMADIDGTVTGGKNTELYTAIKHKAGVAPCTSSVLDKTLDLAPGTNDQGLVAPTNGLTGSWYVINVPQTTTFSGAATAIVATGTTNNVFSPQANAIKAGTMLTTADPLFVSGVETLQAYDVPDFSTPYVAGFATAAQQASFLTGLLARSSVINQYATDEAVSMKTDWVFSMPTRRYSVAANYAAKDVSGAATTQGTADVTVAAPNLAGAKAAYRLFNADVVGTGGAKWFYAGNTSVQDGLICLTASSQKFYDREEQSQTSGAVFSPGKVSVLSLCGETSVLSFASGSVLGAAIAPKSVSASGTYKNGWGEVVFGGLGAPVLGSAFLKATNPSASAGMSGTYGITWPHVYRAAH